MNSDKWKDFSRTEAWLEVRKEVLTELSAVRDILENPENGRDVDMFNKGKAETLRWVANLPEEMAEFSKANAEEDAKAAEINKGGE